MPQLISTKKILTSGCDTFDELALTHCGSERLAGEIIALNPDYCNVVIFGQGTELTIPVFDTKETPETLPPWRQ